MKHLLALVSAFTLALLLFSCADQVTDTYSSATDDQLKDVVLAPGELSEEEAAGLIYMRQEEKVARDVYTVLGEKWNENIFTKITSSEQNHMDAVKKMIIKYELTDPVDEFETVGLFLDEDFQTMYNNLIDQGLVSKEDAMLVGQIIENQDISDLEAQILITDNQDIAKMYERLKAGSLRHLSSFTTHVTPTL